MINGRFQGDPLKGTKWENLTFYEYYEEMSDEERQELKEHLENINAPFTWDVDYREEFYPREFSRTWRDITLMSKEQLKGYYYYNLRLDQIHREAHSQFSEDESLEDEIFRGLHSFGNPLEGTRWEDLTIHQYCTRMSDDERLKFEEYLESINAPSLNNYEDCKHLDWWTWRDIASTALEVVWKKFKISGTYEYIKGVGLFTSTPKNEKLDEEPFDYDSLPF